VQQYPIAIGGGVWLHADFGFPQQRVLVETVGVKGHRSELWQYTHDCRRNNAVSLLRNFVVLHYTWRQIVEQPDAVVAELRAALGLPVQSPFRLLDRPGGRPLLALPLR